MPTGSDNVYYTSEWADIIRKRKLVARKHLITGEIRWMGPKEEGLDL